MKAGLRSHACGLASVPDLRMHGLVGARLLWTSALGGQAAAVGRRSVRDRRSTLCRFRDELCGVSPGVCEFDTGALSTTLGRFALGRLAMRMVRPRSGVRPRCGMVKPERCGM